jgi:eukaryotic-like serine/threonine-protein kinase
VPLSRKSAGKDRFLVIRPESVGGDHRHWSNIALNRLDEAKATYQQALERKLNNPFLHIALYQIAFLQNDVAVMTQQVAWSLGKPGVEDVLLNYEADTAAFSGRMRKARDFSRRAMDSAERAEQKEAAATYSAMAGLREALFNNPDEARRKAGLVMGRTSGRDVRCPLRSPGRMRETMEECRRWPAT